MPVLQEKGTTFRPACCPECGIACSGTQPASALRFAQCKKAAATRESGVSFEAPLEARGKPGKQAAAKAQALPG